MQSAVHRRRAYLLLVICSPLRGWSVGLGWDRFGYGHGYCMGWLGLALIATERVAGLAMRCEGPPQAVIRSTEVQSCTVQYSTVQDQNNSLGVTQQRVGVVGFSSDDGDGAAPTLQYRTAQHSTTISIGR